MNTNAFKDIEKLDESGAVLKGGHKDEEEKKNLSGKHPKHAENRQTNDVGPRLRLIGLRQQVG